MPRPSSDSEPKTVVVTLVDRCEYADWLTSLAEKTHWTRATIVRLALADWAPEEWTRCSSSGRLTAVDALAIHVPATRAKRKLVTSKRSHQL